ncbi:MAG TPA: DUF3575 domain-containing protein [Tangfeifania sp.]|nr:DUF3575 domain-containing protein [Tangfeifania sp.]
MLKTKIICTVFLFAFSTVAFSQNNAVKLGFSDAFLGNYNLSYEKVINENNSVQLKFGYMNPVSSPFISEKTITPEAYDLKETSGGLNASLEYRFYLSRQEIPQGFYIAPYLRYFTQSMVYSDEINDRAFNVDSKLGTFGLGAQLGYQLIVNEIFTFDFYFFGAGVDRHTINLKYQLKDPQPGFDYGTVTNDVTQVFEDINYLEERLEHTVNDDNLTSKLPFLFPGFRLGMSVGVAF